MIALDRYNGQRVGVFGMGRSGLTCARALRAGGATPVCWDDSEAGRERARAEGFEVADLTVADSYGAGEERMRVVALSPGAPHLYPQPHPVAQTAWELDCLVDNDVGLFFSQISAARRESAPNDVPKVVSITGSNGKSTTSALIHHMLKAAGRPAQLGGNIGRGVLDLDPPGPGEIYVLELSSYQTDLARRMTPDVAVLLNLHPDHLDRHGGLGGYFAAKARLFQRGPDHRSGAYLPGPPPHQIIGVDEPEGRYLANHQRSGDADEPVVEISAGRDLSDKTRAVFGQGGVLRVIEAGAEQTPMPIDGAPWLKGAHNVQNAAAAVAACRALGLSHEETLSGLASFPGLPHRLQRVAEQDGVTYVNDSKATNADAAEKALLAYDNVRWIVGGRQKEGGIEPLRPLFGRIRKAYLVGEASEQFAATLRVYPEEVPYEKCGTIDAAVAQAHADAEAGDTVLLAPACASFDQFPDFEKRGEAFIASVETALASQK